MEQTDEVLSDALKYTRTLVAELSPPVLREHGLAAGLTWLAEYMKRHDMTVTVRIPESDDVNLPEDQAVLLFQSVRELLINASKYAESNEAMVTLEQIEDELRIQVRDHGAGLEHAGSHASTPLSSKFGLFSIRERMKALGGRFDLQSAPGKGTMATIGLPLAASGSGCVVNSERPASSKQKSKTPPHSEHVSHQLSAPPLAAHHAPTCCW